MLDTIPQKCYWSHPVLEMKTRAWRMRHTVCGEETRGVCLCLCGCRVLRNASVQVRPPGPLEEEGSKVLTVSSRTELFGHVSQGLFEVG